MPARTAAAHWSGNLTEGKGHIKVQSGTLDAAYDFRARTADSTVGSKITNPEELIAAAHAGCFTMQLSALLAGAGHPAESLNTTAKVYLEKDGPGFAIPKIELELSGKVAGMDAATFKQHAEMAKATCPVSKALAGSTITLTILG